MSKSAKIIFWVVVLALVVWGIGSINKGSRVASGDPIKVGVSTLLSGDWAGLGENIVKAAELAVADVRAQGGIGAGV